MESKELVVAGGKDLIAAKSLEQCPVLLSVAGPSAEFAWDEFVYARLQNPHTRDRYCRAVHRFLAWCEELGLSVKRVGPGHVGRYMDSLELAVSTKKLHLAGLRHFFDRLVERHVIVLNPAASVRGQRYHVVEGKTPEIGVRDARRLLAGIDISHVVGLRDRAIIGILIYTAARVGAVAKLRRQDFCQATDQYCLRFEEKGGKARQIPVRHDLQQLLFSYTQAASLNQVDGSSALFRTTIGRTRRLSDRGVTANDIGRMVKRRCRDAGLSSRLTPHSFRVTTITDLLQQSVPMEEVQNLAGHADPRTTRLYDRRDRQVTRNIVERISI